LRAAEGAMGGGKHFKIRPQIKMMAFPRE